MKINLSKLDVYSSDEKFEKIKRKKPSNWKQKQENKKLKPNSYGSDDNFS